MKKFRLALVAFIVLAWLASLCTNYSSAAPPTIDVWTLNQTSPQLGRTEIVLSRRGSSLKAFGITAVSKYPLHHVYVHSESSRFYLDYDPARWREMLTVLSRHMKVRDQSLGQWQMGEERTICGVNCRRWYHQGQTPMSKNVLVEEWDTHDFNLPDSLMKSLGELTPMSVGRGVPLRRRETSWTADDLGMPIKKVSVKLDTISVVRSKAAPSIFDLPSGLTLTNEEAQVFSLPNSTSIGEPYQLFSVDSKAPEADKHIIKSNESIFGVTPSDLDHLHKDIQERSATNKEQLR